VTQGLGQSLTSLITQRGSGASNLARVSQAGDTNSVTVAAGLGRRPRRRMAAGGPRRRPQRQQRVDLQQGTGTTGTDAFSAGLLRQHRAHRRGDPQPGCRRRPGQQPERRQLQRCAGSAGRRRSDGDRPSGRHRHLGAAQHRPHRAAGRGRRRQPRDCDPGRGRRAVGRRRSGLGSGWGRLLLRGGARSAELNILQSGSTNSATIEQRGRGQFARIEQGPGTGNTASILQDVAATNATAIINRPAATTATTSSRPAPANISASARPGTTTSSPTWSNARKRASPLGRPQPARSAQRA
jgi:hypothetical protein